MRRYIVEQDLETKSTQIRYSQGRAWWTLAILWGAYVLSLVDRQAIVLLIDPIKRDLGVNDTAMGVLHGFTFALFFAIAGFPIARLVDKGSRRAVVGGGIFIWSFATAACGFAQSYYHLLAARVGVASGEASLFPSASSLIADLFSRDQRGRVMGIFATAAFIGLGLGLVVVGLLARIFDGVVVDVPFVGQLKTWQLVFLALGIPGIVFSFLAATMVEPRAMALKRDVIPTKKVIEYMKVHRRLFATYFVGVGLIAISAYSVLAWMPAHFMRSFGWSPVRAGVTLGVIIAVPGLLSSILGGIVADRWAIRGRPDSKMRLLILLALWSFIPSSLMTFMPSGEASAVMFGVFCLSVGAMGGVAPAIILDITPGQMIGRVAAIYAAVMNIIGIGVGPVLVGALTDYVFGYPEAVKYSLPVVASVSIALAAFVLMTGLGSCRKAIKSLE